MTGCTSEPLPLLIHQRARARRAVSLGQGIGTLGEIGDGFVGRLEIAR